MELLKLLTITLLLCPLIVLLLETVASHPSPLATFQPQEKSGAKSGPGSVFAIRIYDPVFTSYESRHVSGIQKSWMSNFRNHLWDLFTTFVPTTAIFAFLITLVLMGTLCCLTFLVGEPIH